MSGLLSSRRSVETQEGPNHFEDNVHVHESLVATANLLSWNSWDHNMAPTFEVGATLAKIRTIRQTY